MNDRLKKKSNETAEGEWMSKKTLTRCKKCGRTEPSKRFCVLWGNCRSNVKNKSDSNTIKKLGQNVIETAGCTSQLEQNVIGERRKKLLQWQECRDSSEISVNNEKEVKRNDHYVTRKAKIKIGEILDESCYIVDEDDTFLIEDKIMDNLEKIKRDQKALDAYEKLSEGDGDLINCIEITDSPPAASINLDCKHLSLKQLENYFNDHFHYIKDIFNEVVEFTRHNMYKNPALRSNLIYNTSTIVFSQDQIQFLLDLLEKKLNPETDCTRYFLTVLLPELCLRIFMIVYEMSHEEAVNYLASRPVE